MFIGPDATLAVDVKEAQGQVVTQGWHIRCAASSLFIILQVQGTVIHCGDSSGGSEPVHSMTWRQWRGRQLLLDVQGMMAVLPSPKASSAAEVEKHDVCIYLQVQTNENHKERQIAGETTRAAMKSIVARCVAGVVSASSRSCAKRKTQPHVAR